jgi:hypothetical protein
MNSFAINVDIFRGLQVGSTSPNQPAFVGDLAQAMALGLD